MQPNHLAAMPLQASCFASLHFCRFANDEGAFHSLPCLYFFIVYSLAGRLVKRISYFSGPRGAAQPISYQRISLASRCSAKLAPPVV